MNLRVREVVARTGLSEGYVYRLIREKKLRSERIRVGPFREVLSVPADAVESLRVPGGEAA